MWKAVCQQCAWTSGEAYLQSVAEVIGKMHEDGNAGHKVAMKEAWRFGDEHEGDESAKPQKPDPAGS